VTTLIRQLVFIILYMPLFCYAQADDVFPVPSEIAKEIIKHDPFPHKITKTRWTINIDKDLDIKKETESNALAKYIIVLIASIFEYILWLLAVILIVFVYLNRTLFSVESLKSLTLKKAPVSTRDIKTTASQINNNILYDIEKLYEKGQLRDAVALMYESFLSIIAESIAQITDNLTEKEVYSLVSTLPVQQLAASIIHLRNKTAYQQKSFDKTELLKVLNQWRQVFSE